MSEDYDIPVAILKLMNPDVSTLTVGDEIEVGKPAYQLSVQTTRSIYYTESIPFTTVYIDNDSIYEGNTAVKTAGSSGSYSVTAEVVTVNGVETERVVTDRVQTVAPVNREIYVGTRTISPSGSFIFPVSSSGYHYKSSNFGWRTLYGSSNYHRGVDLAASYGTAIYAADAGTVISYGWDPYGALGYQIKIDHGNGIGVRIRPLLATFFECLSWKKSLSGRSYRVCGLYREQYRKSSSFRALLFEQRDLF